MGDWMKTTPIVAGLSLMISLFVLFGIAYILVAPTPGSTTPAGIPDKEFEIMGGEIGDMFGFGDTTIIMSPGPELQIKKGDLVKVTFRNVGGIPHTFRITNEKVWDAEPVFGAFVGQPMRPLEPGQVGMTFFIAEEEGTFYYICTVPGHVDRGMFGTIQVGPSD